MTPEKWVPKVGEKVLIRATITEECHGEVVSVLGLSNPCPSDVECTVHFRPRRGEILPDPVPLFRELIEDLDAHLHGMGASCSPAIAKVRAAWPEVNKEEK